MQPEQRSKDDDTRRTWKKIVEAMTPKEANEAISKLCGNDLYVIHKPIYGRFGYYHPNAKGYTNSITGAWKVTLEEGRKYISGLSCEHQPDRVVLKQAPTPDYWNSLDAIVPVIRKMPEEKRSKFSTELHPLSPKAFVIWDEWTVATSEPSQLCEAYLRAMGQWKE